MWWWLIFGAATLIALPISVEWAIVTLVPLAAEIFIIMGTLQIAALLFGLAIGTAIIGTGFAIETIAARTGIPERFWGIGLACVLLVLTQVVAH